MRTMFYVGAVSVLALFAADGAQAGALSAARLADPVALGALPLLRSSVICGSQGCGPVTRVRRCPPKRTPRGTRQACNF